MRGSEVSVPEGPHAVRSTDSLSVSRGFSVADMLQGNTCAHATPSIACSDFKEDGYLDGSIHIAFERNGLIKMVIDHHQ